MNLYYEKYKNLFESSQFSDLMHQESFQYITLVDSEGKLQYINKVPGGYKLEDLIGLSLFSFYKEPDRSKLIRLFELVKVKRERISFQITSITNRRYYANILPFEYESQLFILLLSIDITEQKIFQEISKIVLDSAPFGFAVSQNNTVIDCNPKFAALLGRSMDQVINQTTEDLISPISVEYIKELSAKRLAGETVPTTYLIDVVTGDGSLKTVRHSVTVAIYDGKPALFSYIQDISEELDLKQEREKLIYQYKLLLENSPYGILIIDAKTNQILYINSSMLDMLEGNIREYMDKPAISLVHESMRERIKELGQKRINGEDVPKEYEFDMVTSKGNMVPVQNTVRLADYFGRPAIINYIKDLSEIQKMERERNQLRGIIEQTSRLEKVGTMAASLAHDFNNILMGIDGTISLIEESDSKDTLEYIETIKQASNDAKNIVKQMLDLSGKSTVDSTQLELGEIIKEVEGLIKSLSAQNTQIQYEIPEEPLFFEGNKTQIKQVIVNLVSNANNVFEGQPGNIRIEISKENIDRSNYLNSFLLGSITANSYVSITIENNGPKIDPEILPEIFDPFYSSERSKGRGLGLAVVLGIVRSHNGFIEVKSNDYRTFFKIMLPQLEEIKQKKNSKVSRSKTSPINKKLNILLIDDNPSVLMVTKTMIETLGHHVITNDQRKTAIETIQNFKFDLVITDLSMPDMEFKEFYQLYLDKWSDQFKLMLISGYSTENLETEINNNDITFLSKPFTLSELRDKISDVLG